MTQDVAAVDGAVVAEAEAPAPEGHYWATIKERRVLVKDLSPGQALVLGGLIRTGKSGGFEQSMDVLGKLMLLFDNLIADKADRDWLEEGMLADRIKIEDFSFVFLGAREPAPEKPAKVKPRRGR